MARNRQYPNVCRTIFEFLAQFFPFITIQGLNHLGNPRYHPIERFIWFVLVAIAVYSAYILSSLSIYRFLENPTVISMERDRFSWNTTFPSITICPSTKINKKALETYLRNSPESNKTYLREFIEALAEASYYNFDKIPRYDGIPEQAFMELLLDLKFEFRPAITNSGSANRQYYLEEIVTEMGICYSFNSKLAVYNSPKYWAANNWHLIEGNDTFFVSPLDGEVFANVVNMSTGYEIYIHGPYEVADVATKKVVSPNGYFLQLFLSALTLFSNENVKRLRIKQRK